MKSQERSFFIIVAFVLAFSVTSTAFSDDSTIVQRFGQLRTQGNKLVDQNGNPVVLRGMSLFWSQWMAQFYNAGCVQWLRDDWKCTVVRAAMGIESGGYLTNPAVEKAKVRAVIDACIEAGIYVIVDWHDHNAHNHRSQAITFFQEIATEYGNMPNLIYEIFNEPEQVSWTGVVKPYADSVARYIRAIDPDNVIIVGTPTWSQDVDVAALSPLSYNNIAYALHFYAATHKQALRNKAATALSRGVALFVSEFGTCEATGSGFLDSAEVEIWMTFMNANKLSWCNWSIADKNETSAALKPGASGTGGWPAATLTRSGTIIREKIRSGNDSLLTAITTERKLPEKVELYQNYPNPFNPTTTIEYELDQDGQVKLEIFDVVGRCVRTLLDEHQIGGRHRTTWDGFSDAGRESSGGVYFVRMYFDGHIRTMRTVLLK